MSAETSINAKQPVEPGDPPSRLGEGGVFWRVLRAHWDMRGATKAMFAAHPGETKLFAMLMLACGIYFAARISGHMLTGASDLSARVGAEFVSGVLIRALAFYALAALTCLVANAFGGEATWRDSRTALFWAALASAPLVFASTLIAMLVAHQHYVSMAVELAGQAFFGYAFCVAVAMANKFRSAWGVLGVTVAALAVIFGGLSLILGGVT